MTQKQFKMECAKIRKAAHQFQRDMKNLTTAMQYKEIIKNG